MADIWALAEDNIILLTTLFFATAGIYITVQRYLNAKARPVPFDWPAVSSLDPRPLSISL